MPRQTSPADRSAPGIARHLPLALAALALLSFVAFAARTAGQGDPQLDRFNGFESGGPGDYLVGAGDPSASMTHRPTAGRFGLLTAAASGENEYVQTTFSGATTSFTDGIWACIEQAPDMGFPRRVRSWRNGATTVVELLLTPLGQLELRVNNSIVGQLSPALATCPQFSSVFVEYQAGPGGQAALTVDGVRHAGAHLSNAAINGTRIGSDDGVVGELAVVWDDHGLVTGLTFPTELRIAGLVPRAASPGDAGFVEEWVPTACASAVECTDEQPSDDDGTYISTSLIGAEHMLCLEQPAAHGVFGSILAVKSLALARTTLNTASLGIALRTNSQACGGTIGGGGLSTAVMRTTGTTYSGLARIDHVNPATGADWTVTDVARTAFVVGLNSGANARLTQIVREVAFDVFGFPSPTPTQTPTPTRTATATATATATPTGTDTPTATATATPTVTLTPSTTATDTPTPTRTGTPTITSTATNTPPPTTTFTATSTRTVTATPSPTRTVTHTATATFTPILRALVRANGFEGGYQGDYSVVPQGTTAVVSSESRSGQYALEAAATGGARYVYTSLSAPTTTFTDSIWACFSGSIGAGGERRIRNWSESSNQQPVVELFLLPNARLKLAVGGAALGTSTTFLSVCPTFTQIEVQYQAGGSAALRVNGTVEVAGTHAVTTAVSRAHIGPDDTASTPPRLRWDDHVFSTAAAWPGDLGIVALQPTVDGFYSSAWFQQNCSVANRFNCVQSRPPNIGAWLQSTIANGRQTFCFTQDPVAQGITGPILGVKTIVGAREQNPLIANGGIFLRTGCNDPTGTDNPAGAPEVTFDPSVNFTGFGRFDEVNPVTGSAWAPHELAGTEFGFRHPTNTEFTAVSQVLLEVVFDRDPPVPPSPTPTPTGTVTDTPTRTATATRTTTPSATATITTTPTITNTPMGPTPTPTATGTATPTRTTTRTPTATSTATATPVATATRTATPTNTPLPTATGTVTATGTITATPTDTPIGPSATPSVTPSLTPTETETLTPSVTPTATPTGPTPTPTNTFPPRSDYILAMASANYWECTEERVAALGFSSAGRQLESLARATPLPSEDPDVLRTQFLTLYVAPGLLEVDYAFLRAMSAPGGWIDRFVSQGGLAVIHLAGPEQQGQPPTQSDIAPRGVGFQPAANSLSATIVDGSHPIITGLGIGGQQLATPDFSGWDPTDRGYLTNIPADATVILRSPVSAQRPTLIEYPHGAGKVIVSTLTFCNPGIASQGNPLDNLLKYARAFEGGAQTPAATLTATPTPTETPTGQATRTPTRTQTPTETATAPDTATPEDTPTETPTAPPSGCVGDCGNDGTVSINELVSMVAVALGNAGVETCPVGDQNGDGEITVNELIVAVNNALNGCPPE